MGIRVKVSEWGNSLAIRLPKAVVEQLQLKAGNDADVIVEDGRMALVPVQSVSRARYAEMIAEMKRLMEAGFEPPSPVVWGPDVGQEVLPDEDWSDAFEAWEKAQPHGE
ncbi:MAG: AbrB/MazE/SpoVT family DNA-binding domain-containing protein [Pseudomonadota bacterium]